MSSPTRLNNQHWSPPRPLDDEDMDWAKRPPDDANRIAKAGCRFGCVLMVVGAVAIAAVVVMTVRALLRALGGT
jgi:hypothetical protein